MNKVVNKAIKHLSKDLKLKSLIDNNDKPVFEKNDNYYIALSKSIIYQQLSGKVAKIIYNRFVNLFNDKNPEPNIFLTVDELKLKSIGLSRQKISYLKDLSEYFLNKGTSIDFNILNQDEIRKELITIKGIGHWTIDMFLMFTVLNMNILPVGDLGIKKAFKELYNLDKLPSDHFMIKKSKKWEPYRTIACCYLWTIVDDGDVW
tara:strand:+ start:20346 stop:20957 length:612 start_codon:yes stop_codon:yes gene_type:complete